MDTKNNIQSRSVFPSVSFRGFLFPQIPRFFSAPVFVVTGKLMLWAALLLLWGVNIASLRLSRPFWPLSLAVVERPKSLLPHLTLAQAHWQAGRLAASRRELLLAQELWQQGVKGDLAGSENHVLGSFTTPLDLLSRWQNEPVRLEKEYQFWQDMVGRYPGWRDGYVYLVALAFRLNKLSEGRLYLDEVRSLDPNFLLLPQLETLLGQN